MKLKISNVPVRAFATVTVEIPDDTPLDYIQEAVSKAIGECALRTLCTGTDKNTVEVDPSCVNAGWQFEIEEVK